MFSLVFLLKGSLPRAASRGAGLVLASDFQRTSLPLASRLAPLSRKAGAKVLPFFHPASGFLQNFSRNFYYTEYQ